MYVPLTKKFQTQDFESIIGQNTAVRILKNSLFLRHFFPVYLFSGQHGCGKTSTARLFATTLNCEKLEQFSRDPKIVFPCTFCASCVAMKRVNHPDFVEIDGASHTGVDTVRELIESVTFLPILGTYKIYLIDEAHMLSKSACNALLKVFEDTPPNVIFILATTASDKIIETVRSRSFQLFFAPVSNETLTAYLEHVATKEGITYSRAGMIMIAEGSRGSVRDSLNLLEQVRLSANNVVPETVREVLAWADEDLIRTLMSGLISKNRDHVVSALKNIQASTTLIFPVFERLICVLRALLWELFGVHTGCIVKKELLNTKPETVLHILSHLYSYEQLLKKTQQQRALFEFILLDYVHGASKQIDELPVGKSTAVGDKGMSEVVFRVEKKQEEAPSTQMPAAVVVSDVHQESWQRFVSAIVQKGDPLLGSIFLQARFNSFQTDTMTVSVLFKKEFQFFASILEENQVEWLPVLQSQFGGSPVLVWEFLVSEKDQKTEIAPSVIMPVKKAEHKNIPVQSNTAPVFQRRSQTKPPRMIIKNTDNLPYARIVQNVFPGTITIVEKGTHE